MSDRDYNRFDPIVPTSDDRIGRGEARERTSESNQRPAREKAPAKPRSSGGGAGALWKFLVLVLAVGLGGLGYFFVEQTRRFEVLQTRFNDLEAKIASTDESLSQSGAALSIKIKDQQKSLDEHWSEIKKLWGVAYDKNRKAIEEQDKTLKGLQASMAARKKEIDALGGKLDKAGKSVETAASSALAVKLEVNDMVGQVQDMADRMNRLEKTLKDSQQNMNSRIAGNEEAIRAIDAYRLQINRDLQLIKQQLGTPQG